MLVIRLRRIGRKHDPHYRIVVTEHTAPIQGKFLTEIGHYHPKSKESVIDEAKMTDWMNKGAKPSNTVARLAQKAKITHKHIVVKQLTGAPKKKAQTALEAKNAPKVTESDSASSSSSRSGEVGTDIGEPDSTEPDTEETTPEADAPETTEAGTEETPSDKVEEVAPEATDETPSE